MKRFTQNLIGCIGFFKFNIIKTLQILLESFCVHLPARSFFCFSQGGSLCLILGTCLPSLWIPPLLLHSDPPLSRQGMALAHLNSLPPHDLVLWTDGSIPIHFGKGGLAYLPTAFFVALRPLLFFRQAQYVQVFPLKPAPSCKLFAGLGSTNEVCHFSSLSLTLALSSPPCPLLRLFFYVKLCGRSGRKCLLSPPVLSDHNGSPDTHSSRETTRLISWPDEERYSCPLQFYAVSLLLPLVSTLLFVRPEAYCLIEFLRHTGFLDFH